MSAKYGQILINNELLDVITINNNSFSIDYSIDDNADFSKVTASRTNFSLPTTKKVLKLFGHFEEVETKTGDKLDFKPAQVIVDGVPILTGKAQLLKTTEVRNPEKADVGFWGNNGGWIIALKGKRLKDLNFQTFNIGGTTIKDSWAGNADNFDFACVPVNYGQWYDAAGKGICKDDIRPHFYVKKIVDKIFNGIGYKCESSFFNTTFFKKLLWLWSGDVNNGVTLNDAYGKAGDLSGHIETTISNGNTVYNQVIKTEQVYSPGDYIYSLSVFYDYFADHQLGADLLWGVGIYLHDLGNNTTTVIAESNLQGRPQNPPGDTIDLISNTIRLTEDDLGKEIVFKIRWKDDPAGAINIPYNTDFYYTGSYVVQLENTYVTGQDIVMSRVLGNDLQSDFLRGLTEMFNLKWTADNNSKTVYVEPRNRNYCPYANYTPFYNLSKFKDWTVKKDTGKPLIVQGFNVGAKIDFKYRADNSDTNINAANDNANIELYAARAKILNDENSTEATIFQNSFFTACFHIYDTKVTGTGSYYLPCCWTSEKPNANDYPAQDYAIENKIIYFEGMSDLYQVRFEGNLEPTIPLAYQVNYDNVGSPNTVNLSYADITGAVLADVMPGLARIFWGWLIATYRENKSVNGQFILSPADINELDFRTLIKVRGDRYILQSVTGYNPFNDGPTEINLIYDKAPEQADIDAITHSNLKGFTNG